MRDVILKFEPVELYKILKFESMAPSGGVAKLAIESGDVIVNGAVETRKRKKIIAGDIIEFNGEKIRLILQD
jgi:ribosome-associated protein